MNDILLADLLRKQREHSATSAELSLLESWYLHESSKPAESFAEGQLENAGQEIWNTILENTGIAEPKPTRKIWYTLAAAAVVLVTLSTGVLFYFKTNSANVELIVPGEDQATLMLGDGTVILLNNAGEGKLADQEGAIMTKTSDGKLIYSNSHSGAIPRYHTIKTPKGGQYRMVLPDGSTVWLNAASSLKYPSSFTPLRERRVVLTGEAYFEIKKTRKPFKVISRGQEVTVLGTKFNINGYSDEPTVRTTLIEGSLRVVALEASGKGIKRAYVILKAGEQSEVADYMIQVNKEIAAENDLAWRSGEFRFNNLGINGFMRTVSRWYDVDVYYKGEVPDISYGGSISRSTKFKTLLEMMEYIGYVKFEVDGRRVIVSRPPVVIHKPAKK
ncbi:MAG: FecR family protein [Pedobacter sp.]|nr:MAG: FecR family protein [Pedobacter sp.]